MSKIMRAIKTPVAWLLLFTTIVYMLSGFGITYQNIIGPLTLGLLGKALSFQIHDWLWIPFVILLVVHVSIAISGRMGRRQVKLL